MVEQSMPPTIADNILPALKPIDMEDVDRTNPNHTTQSLLMDVQQNSAFLNLPTEIRIYIFDYLMKSRDELPVCLMVSKNVYVWGQGFPDDMASCTRVCKQLHREIQDIVWERLLFKIRPDNGRGLSSSTLVGKADDCKLFSKLRYAEICFPIAAIHSFDGPTYNEQVKKRMKVCLALLERNTSLRKLSFNCDTTAFVGQHDELGVELFARTFCPLLVKKRNEIDIQLTNIDKGSNGAICLRVFREGGLIHSTE